MVSLTGPGFDSPQLHEHYKTAPPIRRGFVFEEKKKLVFNLFEENKNTPQGGAVSFCNT